LAKKLKWLLPIIIVSVVSLLIVAAKFFIFKPDKGMLHLESKRTIELLIDGQSYGTGMDFELNLTPGSYEYQGIMTGLANQKMILKGIFSIDFGKTTSVVCGADPEIEFQSEPKGAKVTILADEAPVIGSTPVKVSLPPGTYTFLFNLSGKAVEKGPITLDFDDKKKVQVLFDNLQTKQSKPSDTLFIDSTPEGLMVYDKNKLVGITPVSFENKRNLSVKDNGFGLDIPIVFNKQFVWVHPSTNMYMAISESKIEFSNHLWFANGGFFSSYIENGFVRIEFDQGNTIQTKLPSFDWIVGFGTHGSQLAWVGVKGSSLLIETYDQLTGKRVEPNQKEQLLYMFTKTMQSPSGNTTRFFKSHGLKLYELDSSQMKAIELGDLVTGTVLRRMGETSDFGVGMFTANGKCTGVLSRRYKWYPQSPMNIGFVKSTQPPIMLFYSGTKLVGFNTDSGSIEWESNIEEEPLQIIWNENEQVWIAESLDSSRYYMINQNDGQVIPLDKGSTMAQENPNPGYCVAGYYVGNEKYIQLSIKPGLELTAISEGKVIWTVACQEVFSTKAFNPLTEVGKVYVFNGDKFCSLDLYSGQITQVDGQPLEFFESGAVLCNNGVWSGKNKVFYGSCSVSEYGNSLKISLQDGTACVILP
jgi:hypothetical protein